jgi:hypothetical protein
MGKRGLKSTGFPDTDREILQHEFDEEFKQDLENARAVRREVRRRAARQAGLQRRRMMMEKMLQEEQDELARNHQVGMMIELVKENSFAVSARLDVNSVSARCLAKAMWLNNTITCLDLSSNDLSDHAGSYLARMLKRNTTLKKLELDNNNLGKLSCIAFSESLAINNTLIYLSLDSNPLCTEDGIAAFTSFTEALSVNRSLKSLNLWRIGAGVVGGALISRNVLKNPQLLFCDVNHNGMEMKDIVMITNQLDKNLTRFEEDERIRRKDEEYERKVEEAEKQKGEVSDLTSLCDRVDCLRRVNRSNENSPIGSRKDDANELNLAVCKRCEPPFSSSSLTPLCAGGAIGTNPLGARGEAATASRGERESAEGSRRSRGQKEKEKREGQRS